MSNLYSGNRDLRTNDPSTVLGLKRGVVKSLKDPDKLNRVQVTLVDEGLDTPFADVMASFAGDATGAVGSVCIPQVGEEVLLGFLDGKINNPVILGGLYNSKFKPPLIIDEKNEKWHMKTYAGTEITVDNTKDKQKIEIKTKKEHIITLDDDEESLVATSKDLKTGIFISFKKGEIDIIADKKISFEAGKDTMVLEADKGLAVSSSSGEMKVDTKDIKLTASANLEGKANAQAKIEGSSGAELKSSGPVKVESSAMATLKGSMVKIN